MLRNRKFDIKSGRKAMEDVCVGRIEEMKGRRPLGIT
jgi:hypothetical protein